MADTSTSTNVVELETPLCSTLAELVKLQSKAEDGISPNNAIAFWDYNYKQPLAAATTMQPKKISFADMFSAVRRIAARLVSSEIAVGKQDKIAVISETTLECWLTMLAVWSIGAVVVPLNYRHTNEMLVDAIQATNVKFIATSRCFIDIARQLQTEHFQEMKLLLLDYKTEAEADFLFCTSSDDVHSPPQLSQQGEEETTPRADVRGEDVAIILHTSGTTKKPKYVPLQHQHILYGQAVQYHTDCLNKETKEAIRSHVLLISGPLYHIMSHIGFLRCLYMRSTAVVPKLQNAYLPIAPSQMLDYIDAGVDRLSLPPAMLEYIREYTEQHPERKATLRKLSHVIFGGGPAPRDLLLWYLRECNVRLYSMYGMTECASVLLLYAPYFSVEETKRLANENPDLLFCMSIPPTVNAHFVSSSIDNKWKELVACNDPVEVALPLGYLNNEQATKERFPSDPKIFHTGDLFEELHPNLWHFVSRADNVLVHTNGEKTNPVVIETEMAASPLVARCVVIGHQRPYNILLVERAAQYYDMSEEEMFGKIWRCVKHINQKIPSYSRIAKPNLWLLPQGTNLPSTVKGDVPRRRAITLFGEQIERIYTNSEQQQQQPIQPTGASSDETTLETNFVYGDETKLKAIVSETASAILRHPETRGSTLLAELGLDSLKAVLIRNELARRLNIAPHMIPASIFFENTTVDSLTRYLVTHVFETGGALQPQAEVQPDLDNEVKSLLFTDSEIASFGSQRATLAEKALLRKKRVLLTGSTGFLGSFLLHQLLHATDCSIVCLVRALDNHSAMTKLKDRLQQSEIAQDFQDEQLWARVEVIACTDLEQPLFGIPQQKYTELTSSVDFVLHNAATVRFDLSYASLKPSNVIATRNLLLFSCQQQLKEFHYISSISAALNTKQQNAQHPPTVFENQRLTQQDCMPMGYAQSKYVCEGLIQELAQRGLCRSPCIYRVGNITGHSQTGVWNANDNVPRILRGSVMLGLMPSLGSFVDWLPVDSVSGSVVQIMKTHRASFATEAATVFHIVNPHSTHWDNIQQLVCKLRPHVKPATLQQLITAVHQVAQQQQQTRDTHPLVALLPFLESMQATTTAGETERKGRETRFDCSNTLHALEGKGIELPPVDEKLLRVYLDKLVPAEPAAATTQQAQQTGTTQFQSPA